MEENIQIEKESPLPEIPKKKTLTFFNKSGLKKILKYKTPLAFILLLLLIVTLTVSIYALNKSQNLENTALVPTQAPTPTTHPTPTINKVVVALPATNSWNTYKFEYGGYQFDYPSNWYFNDCPSGGGGPYNCLNINVIDATHNKDNFSGDGMINIGDKNPYYHKQTGDIVKNFTVYGLNYQIGMYPEAFKTHGYSTDGAETILQKIVDSIKPLNNQSTCASPSLVPLNNFPNNFTLSDMHISDGSDLETSEWPDATTNHFPTPSPKGYDDWRQFMVTYVKSGDLFTDSADFDKSVAEVTKTQILHINCIDTEGDQDVENPTHKISSDQNDPLAIHLYGYATNPTKLWGVEKWNINLLKSTRNEVYIKMGNQWQKYVARDYFSTEPMRGGGKPVIYLYPQKNTPVNISFSTKMDLSLSIPLYKNGWNVAAHPNGELTDLQPQFTPCKTLDTSKFGSEYAKGACVSNSYPYLYWEGKPKNESFPIPNEGWNITSTQLKDFLVSSLTKMGLSPKEQADMLSYWIPVMEKTKAPYFYVSFLQTKELDKLVPMGITPKPDSVIRVFMSWYPLFEKPQISPNPQILNPVTRTGFTVVEWGGLKENQDNK